METSSIILGSLGGLSAFSVLITLLAFRFRRVVNANEVHIVQSAKHTTSFGKDTGNGNTYYEWPSWLPIIGVSKTVLPLSNFDVTLEDFEAYDEGRLPFVVDVKAFFRISDSNEAAKRVVNFLELTKQLNTLVQGSIRSVLASHKLEEIMQGRSKFGDDFTDAVKDHLKNWGVEAVRNIELTDIRDHAGSKVISNIMEKKKSFIEMESRTEVAKNMKTAQIAEIEAKQQIDLQKQNAEQMVGLRTVETKRQVAVSEQNAVQTIKEQERVTKEKEMAVLQVQQVRTAEINRDTSVVKAEQERQTAIIAAEAKLGTQKLEAEGNLELTKRNAEGITLEGKAKADAERAMLLAPVEAQTTLAKEIGDNKPYQEYLITIRQVEANQAVGIAQASALSQAEVKVISNTGSPTQGISNVMDLFSSKGGTEIGAMLEGLANTDHGKALAEKFLGKPEKTVAVEKKKALSNGNGAGH